MLRIYLSALPCLKDAINELLPKEHCLKSIEDVGKCAEDYGYLALAFATQQRMNFWSPSGKDVIQDI